QSRWFDEGFDRLLVSKVFLTKGGQAASPVECSSNGGACVTSVWMKKLPLDGEHKDLNDSHLRGRLLWQV
ncbi:hypothetical protein A2U01_0099446, partial [Trifolium medium]|nr:hypothetical protein [Trifolium medium]